MRWLCPLCGSPVTLVNTREHGQIGRKQVMVSCLDWSCTNDFHLEVTAPTWVGARKLAKAMMTSIQARSSIWFYDFRRRAKGRRERGKW